MDTDAYHYHSNGIAAYNLKRYESAISYIDKAIQVNPNIPLFYIDRAVAKHSLNQFEEALLDIDRAIELLPNDPFLLRFRQLIVSQFQLPMNQQIDSED